MRPTIEAVMTLMLRGRYMAPCGEVPKNLTLFDIALGKHRPEKIKVCDKDHRTIGFIFSRDITRYKLWRVMLKDNDLAFRKGIDRYKLSPAKILSLRKNNRIKVTYKALRSSITDHA